MGASISLGYRRLLSSHRVIDEEMQVPLACPVRFSAFLVEPSDPGIVSSQILVAVVLIAPTAREKALFRSTKSIGLDVR